MTCDAVYRERRYTSQDGLSLYFRDYGEELSGRSAVLCLPGLTRNSKDFATMATRLSATRRVICPDFRGRGRSDYDTDWRNYTPATYLGDLRHLLTVCGLHRVVVIGTSLGGLLAAAMYALVPAALAGVVINDIGPEPDPAGLERIAAYIGTDRPQPDLDAAASSLRNLLPDLSLEDDAAWLRFADSSYRQGEDGLYHYDWDVRLARHLRNSDAGDLPDLWPLFNALSRIPGVAVRGARSDVLRSETFVRMRAALPDFEFVTVEGIGHAPTLAEAPAADAIDRLLSRVDDD